MGLDLEIFYAIMHLFRIQNSNNLFKCKDSGRGRNTICGIGDLDCVLIGLTPYFSVYKIHVASWALLSIFLKRGSYDVALAGLL